MSYLLDTQTLLWIVVDHPQLSRRVRGIYLDQANEVFLSNASIWEMAIKISIGKLKLDDTLENFVSKHVKGNGTKILQIELEHLYPLENIPFHHRDPFNRLIISQSMVTNYPVLSSDQKFDLYPI